MLQERVWLKMGDSAVLVGQTVNIAGQKCYYPPNRQHEMTLLIKLTFFAILVRS